MKDASPGDIYADETGKLWRVVGIFTDPSVIIEEVDKSDGVKERVRRHGGVNARMWQGFVKKWQAT